MLLVFLGVALVRSRGERRGRGRTGWSGRSGVQAAGAGTQDRSRELAGLGATLDLEEVLRRILRLAVSTPSVDAAMVVVARGDSGPFAATTGLTVAEATRQPLPLFPGGGETRALAMDYREEEVNEPDAVAGGLLIPLVHEDGEAIGTLAAYWRRRHEPGEEELDLLQELAARAAPALENAWRYRAASELAHLDGLTKLRNQRYFHDTLAHEVTRAQRYSRELAIVVFDIDDFKAMNDRNGHLVGDAVLAELGARVRSVVRTADIACRVGGDEFAIILPESSLWDAEQLYRRLQNTLAARPSGREGDLRLSAGIAVLRPQENAVSFFERADRALYRAKQAGKGQALAEENP